MATAPTMYHVEILKIIDASRFWAREISMGDASDEAKQFQQLTARLNNYGETAKMKAHIDNPVLGEIYIGKCAKRHGAWCRVRVDNTLHTSQGLKAQCYLVDYGIDNELIPLWHLRPIPDEFCILPCQAKKCILHGVKPVSLQLEVNDSIHMGLGPSSRWDSSSKKFFKNLVEALSDQSLSDPDLSTDGDPTQEVRHTMPSLSGSTIRHPITRWDATERSPVSSNHNILSHGSPVRLGKSQMLGGSGSSEEPPGLSRSNISQIICNSPLGRGQSIKSSLKRSESSELVALSLGSPPDSFKHLCSPNLPLDVNMSTKMDPYLENGDAKQSSYHSQEPLFSPRTNLNFTADTLPSRELLPVIGRGRGLLSAMISMSPSKRSEETSEITCSYNQKLPVKSSEEVKLPSREPLSSSQSNHILESSLMLNGKPKNRINPISNPASTTLNESRQDNSPAKANSQVFSQKESLHSFTRAGSPFTKVSYHLYFKAHSYLFLLCTFMRLL
ncbi:hypothetical protein LSH36_65g06000 [Paralvinella palmiformis]|uniref:RNA helicase n=1 Tax=Paralvinella palmiformis TaxID=53620 RepID=A0AAD9K3S7_9ANNE|nr:hypothetical protein LSH36_65g06000 [Paralvinella palmiformis]